MDVLSIKTKATSMIVETLIKRAIYKKFGITAQLQIKDVRISHNDGETYSIHLDLNAAIPEKDISQLIQTL